MGRLGILIYLEKIIFKEIYDYIDKVVENGFICIFLCLLLVKDIKENIIKKFKCINEYVKFKGFEVIFDVNFRVFGELEISYKDLIFFKKMKVDGIRFDMGFIGFEEVLMIFNF